MISEGETMKLNCDLGESFGRWHLTDEAQIMPYIDMANIACGFHAGDPLNMIQTLRLARKHQVTAGAHPGYPDLVGFGRRTIPMSSEELRTTLLYQIGALDMLARAEGISLRYVKPHGALYNDMMRDTTIFETVTAALADTRSDLKLMVLSTADNDHYNDIAQKRGIKLLFEFFADRAYTHDGILLPRSEKGAVIHDTATVLSRIRQIVRDGTVTTHDGIRLPLRVDTICVHGDNPEAIALTQAIRKELEEMA